MRSFLPSWHQNPSRSTAPAGRLTQLLLAFRLLSHPDGASSDEPTDQHSWPAASSETNCGSDFLAH
jgi:hypothetical protein